MPSHDSPTARALRPLIEHRLTEHGRCRIAQRGVKNEDLACALLHGHTLRSGAVELIFLGRRDLARAAKLVPRGMRDGLLIVMSDEHIVTVYHDKNAPQRLRRRATPRARRARRRYDCWA